MAIVLLSSPLLIDFGRSGWSSRSVVSESQSTLRQTMATLDLCVGDAQPFYVYLTDSKDLGANLSAATGARFTILTDVGGSVLFSKTATIDIPNSRVVISPTQGEADAFIPGEYPAQVSILINSVWRKSLRFYVTIEKAIAPNTL